MNSVTDASQVYVPLNDVNEESDSELESNNDHDNRIRQCFSCCMECVRDTMSPQHLSIFFNRTCYVIMGMGIMAIIDGFDQDDSKTIYSGCGIILAASLGLCLGMMMRSRP